jgi:branched-chain amino acid transport system permease protein
VSLAVQTLMFSLFYNWTSTEAEPGTLQNLTNGPFGLSGIAKPRIFGWQLQSIESIAVLAFGLLVLAGGLCWLLVSSPWRRLLKVLQDDELAVEWLRD